MGQQKELHLRSDGDAHEPLYTTHSRQHGICVHISFCATQPHVVDHLNADFKKLTRAVWNNIARNNPRKFYLDRFQTAINTARYEGIVIGSRGEAQ